MEDFRGEFQRPERPNRPHFIHKPRPFEATTTNQEDFKYWGAPERRNLVKLKDNGLGSGGIPFEGITTNQHDFRKWNSKPAQAVLKQDSRAFMVPDDRDFETEFAGQFVPKAGATRRSRAPNGQKTVSLPFEGVTTAQADFKEWPLRPQRFSNPAQNHTYKPRKDDREFLTEARSEYTQKPIDFLPAVTTKPDASHITARENALPW